MDVAANLTHIKARIPPGVTLVAVSKTQTAAAIQAALVAGQRVFGENRVQEAHAHWAVLRPLYPDLRLHLIGHLQTNKVRAAVSLFDVIETVDSTRLADALAREMRAQGRALPCFIQVNIGEEPQKDGVAPDAAPVLLAHCRDAGLAVAGLMCIPPAGADPAPYFRRLADMARAMGLAQLSMGMSADYEEAIKAGATHVRVGSALFGARISKI
ncbi:MAG: YggS family pyridoxal phosphate-dependent enzyme [Rhodospirillales bacterium]|nr:YggS family pyridoxal phosphate-dependent enzyme [Alphaproteobacteria bacterium]MCB9986534.1 YggS family pyridoxal phosphate-dependent enzyme [Rhodospirillales bacterium]USO06930.1 MAG: YggS family pyridoxal phosphate-dependent enzyme [Rhodospirillales bacterium]